jgi:iron complex transport system substrate-binding protein
MIRFLTRTLSAAVLASTLVMVSASVGSAASTTPCIVSLSPTATDSLFAIGAGSMVKAVDQDSTIPAAAAALARKTHINALSPSVEGILGLCPTASSEYVIISYDPSDFAQRMTALGAHVIAQNAPTTLAGALDQIRALGVITSRQTQANSLAATMQRSIAADAASVAAHRTKTVKVYYEISAAPYYSLTSSTFVGSLLKLLGVVNIADPQSTSSDAGYPALTPEYIVKANPNLVFLAGDATAPSVSTRAGWESITAVKTGHVVALNGSVASEWGPLLLTLMNQLTAAVKADLADAHVWK